MIILAALVAACAAQKPVQVANKTAVAYSTPGQAKPKGRMQCRYERDTGSNFMDKVCNYVDDPNDDNLSTQEGMRRLQQMGDQKRQMSGTP